MYERIGLSRKHQLALQTSEIVPDVSPVLLFNIQHPLYSSHGVRPLHSSHEWVPNFIGPSLPRSDKGDREFYCATMLSLFAPWRTGLDLKLQVSTWDDAFGAFGFKPGHRSIMQNMNVRYECLDA